MTEEEEEDEKEEEDDDDDEKIGKLRVRKNCSNGNAKIPIRYMPLLWVSGYYESHTKNISIIDKQTVTSH